MDLSGGRGRGERDGRVSLRKKEAIQRVRIELGRVGKMETRR